ncbi:MAG: DedA family protein [Candidatus Sungbacteria bacterium]|nr:DedA family protein [Candidatus Sungbacteria bacterium]
MLAVILLPLDSEAALYLVLFGILFFSGVGLPVPEEVTLLLGGYLAYLEFIDFWITTYVLIAGIVAADILGYFLGRYAGQWLTDRISRWDRAVLVLEWGKKYFVRHGEKVVLFSRPLLGVRVAVPIMAGHFRMNFVKFLLLDTIAAIPWTFLLVFLSFYLGSGLDLITEAREIKHIMFGIVLAVVAVLAVRFIRKYPARETK